MASIEFSTVAYPVMTIIEVSGWSALTCDKTSKPDKPGIIRSSRMTSKCAFSIIFNPCSPFSASTTSNPSGANTSREPSRITFSSSTTRILGLNEISEDCFPVMFLNAFRYLHYETVICSSGIYSGSSIKNVVPLELISLIEIWPPFSFTIP